MRVLVTGAKGFVGQNLVASLEAVRDGWDRRPQYQQPATRGLGKRQGHMHRQGPGHVREG